MDSDFGKIVKRKSKDELVRILINKDEYKNELVDAARGELKLRDHSTPVVKQIIQTQISEKIDTPFGIYLAGVLLFLASPIWLIVGLAQAGVSALANNSAIGALAIWNTFAAALSVVLGIGILKGEKWGYNWGLGTAFLNTLWFAYLYSQSEWMFLGFLTISQIVVFISLRTNKNYFFTMPDLLLHPRGPAFGLNGNHHLNSDRDNDEALIRLHFLIRTNTNSMLSSSNSAEINKMLSTICDTLDKSSNVLSLYQKKFGVDLIADLTTLSNNYDKIKEHCQVFIDKGLVSKKYPHERLLDKS